MKMSNGQIGAVLVAYKEGKVLEYFSYDRNMWRASQAESADEILYNIVFCDTEYREVI